MTVIDTGSKREVGKKSLSAYGCRGICKYAAKGFIRALRVSHFLLLKYNILRNTRQGKYIS